MYKVLSWEYVSLSKEYYGENTVEIYEYSGKVCVRITNKTNHVDVLQTADEQLGWDLYNKLRKAFM